MLGAEQPKGLAVLEAKSQERFQTDLQVGNNLKQTRKANNHAVFRRESDEIASYRQVKIMNNSNQKPLSDDEIEEVLVEIRR